MENRHHIQAELKDTCPLLAETVPVNPFTVPYDYFNNLASAIMEKIPVGMVSNPFQVPAGYFESLSDNILAKIRGKKAVDDITAELKEVAPFLASVNRSVPYSAPEDYFEVLRATSPQKKQAKVANIRFAKKWMQYAAAAVTAGILVTSAFLFTDSENESEYAGYTRMDVPAELDKVSETDLVKYLDNQSTHTANMASPVEVKSTIQEVSDEELSQYLKENADADVTIPVSTN